MVAICLLTTKNLMHTNLVNSNVSINSVSLVFLLVIPSLRLRIVRTMTVHPFT